MLGAMKVLGGVLVLGRIAAANVAALHAKAKVNPSVTHFQTLFAAGGVRRDFMDLREMRAGRRHDFAPFIERVQGKEMKRDEEDVPRLRRYEATEEGSLAAPAHGRQARDDTFFPRSWWMRSFACKRSGGSWYGRGRADMGSSDAGQGEWVERRTRD
jgi:hypothetical protein